MKKLLFAMVFLAVSGVVAWQVYVRLTEEKKDPSQRRGGGETVAVELAPVRTAAVRDVMEFTGTLEARSRFTVSPKVGGRLKKLHADIGMQVENGKLIAEIDDEEYLLRVAQAEAELEVAQANVDESSSALDTARREFERIEALQAKKIASESELDAASAQYKARAAKDKVARAQVTQRKAALDAERVRLSDTKIKSIWESGDDGLRVVGERFIHEGAMIVPNSPLVSIIDIRIILAVVFAAERNYPLFKPGLKTTVYTDAFPGRPFEGKVARVSPVLQENTRKARVELEIPNPDLLLKPGMFVRAEVEIASRENATVVPVASVVRRDGKEGVFLADMENKKAAFVALNLGIRQQDVVEVLSPPVSGMVVVLGQHLLRDGSTIMLPGRNGKDSGDRKPGPGGGGPPGRGPRGGGGGGR